MKKINKILLAFLGLVLVTLCVQSGVLTPDATAILAFTPLLWNKGQNNMGGYSNFAVVIPLSYISAAPKVPAWTENPTDFASIVTATGTFTFNNQPSSGSGSSTPYSPIFVYSTDAKTKYNAESQGEIDGKSFNQTGEFFYPGNEKECSGFASYMKNRPCIIVIADPDGRQQMIGTPELPAYISPAKHGGAARADLRGTTFTFQASSNQDTVFLQSPLNINPLTGAVSLSSGSGA